MKYWLFSDYNINVSVALSVLTQWRFWCSDLSFILSTKVAKSKNTPAFTLIRSYIMTEEINLSKDLNRAWTKWIKRVCIIIKVRKCVLYMSLSDYPLKVPIMSYYKYNMYCLIKITELMYLVRLELACVLIDYKHNVYS